MDRRFDVLKLTHLVQAKASDDKRRIRQFNAAAAQCKTERDVRVS